MEHTDAARSGLTVAIVGVTLDPGFPDLPPGFRAVAHTAVLGVGADLWSTVSAELGTWSTKERAGFRVPDGPVELGRDVDIRLGPLREPVRVVAVVDEPHRRGFAYATRPGHPLRGEELFLVKRDDEGVVRFTVRSISAPGAGGWRLVWPVILLAQRRFARRYLSVHAPR